MYVCVCVFVCVCVCVCVCMVGVYLRGASGCVRYVALFSNSFWGGDSGYGNWSTYLGWE